MVPRKVPLRVVYDSRTEINFYDSTIESSRVEVQTTPTPQPISKDYPSPFNEKSIHSSTIPHSIFNIIEEYVHYPHLQRTDSIPSLHIQSELEVQGEVNTEAYYT
ncbi:TMN2 [Acrasis kona]|uniref:TMN2 n=1 Tax=Acrasis kona TaxID=1008807 RepID=A0AAW2YRM4_9EUKA